ncbi:MAG: Fe-S cluster assembly transcription factor [Pseudomonadota bacterium]
MRLTTKGRFAVTAMIDLALRFDCAQAGAQSTPLTLSSISERQKISLSYLEQLFGKLRRHQLVDSVRGPGGGYCLARPMAQISVADIIAAVDEPLDATQCAGKENCTGEERCMTHELWTNLNLKMHEYLSSVSLDHLVQQQRERGAKKIRVLQDQRVAKSALPADCLVTGQMPMSSPGKQKAIDLEMGQ